MGRYGLAVDITFPQTRALRRSSATARVPSPINHVAAATKKRAAIASSQDRRRRAPPQEARDRPARDLRLPTTSRAPSISPSWAPDQGRPGRSGANDGGARSLAQRCTIGCAGRSPAAQPPLGGVSPLRHHCSRMRASMGSRATDPGTGGGSCCRKASSASTSERAGSGRETEQREERSRSAPAPSPGREGARRRAR